MNESTYLLGFIGAMTFVTVVLGLSLVFFGKASNKDMLELLFQLVKPEPRTIFAALIVVATLPSSLDALHLLLYAAAITLACTLSLTIFVVKKMATAETGNHPAEQQ